MDSKLSTSEFLPRWIRISAQVPRAFCESISTKPSKVHSDLGYHKTSRAQDLGLVDLPRCR